MFCPTALNIFLTAAWQNKQNNLCTQQRLRSVWTSAQSDQSLLSAWRSCRSMAILRLHSKTFIRLGRWPGWSESSLGAQSCHFVYFVLLTVRAAAHFYMQWVKLVFWQGVTSHWKICVIKVNVIKVEIMNLHNLWPTDWSTLDGASDWRLFQWNR